MMKSLRISSVALPLVMLAGAQAAAAELVMAEVQGCSYCLKFDREMAPLYQSSGMAKKLPLRRVDLSKWPARLKGIDRPPGAPAFILVEDGRELGRFYGYTGREKFQKSLARLLKGS